MSSPSAKNISLRGLLDAALLIPAVPPRLKRGVSRSSRTWSAGCGGRGWRFRRRRFTSRTAKSCGPDAPTLASTGDDASHHAGMVTTSPVHQGEHEGNRKTIAQGRPDRSGEPVVYLLVCFLFYIRGCGRIGRPVFPAPSHGRKAYARLGRLSRCGNEKAYLKRRGVSELFSSFRSARERESGIHLSRHYCGAMDSQVRNCASEVCAFRRIPE